jgi:hypothetical protein
MARNKPIDAMDFGASVPEWGVSRETSSAVPLVVSGSQFKSTNNLGLKMENILRIKTSPHVNFKALADLKAALKTAKKKVAFKAKKSR